MELAKNYQKVDTFSDLLQSLINNIGELKDIAGKETYAEESRRSYGN